MKSAHILEACVDSAESAIIAAKAGANRFELCANLVIGGTTPSPCLFEEIRKCVDTRTHILIRPRFGDFCYTEHECRIMENEIAMFRKLGAEGVVIGALTPEGTLDEEKMKRLIEQAGDMTVALHRAFDMCRDPFEALEQAKKLNIKTILTSGHKQSALAGKDLLKKLMEKSEGKIEILMGGGINADAIRILLKETGNRSFHMSGKVTLDSLMTYRKQEVTMGLPSMSEYEIWRTDSNKIEEAVMVLEQLQPSVDKFSSAIAGCQL